MQGNKRQRRSREEWHSLIEEQNDSGLSAPAFCKQQNISYERFCVWSRRFQSDIPRRVEEVPAQSQSSFIDLSHLSSPPTHWRITLKLGNGVELELSQI